MIYLILNFRWRPRAFVAFGTFRASRSTCPGRQFSHGAVLASLQADLSIQDGLLATFQGDLSVQNDLPATLQVDLSVQNDLLATLQTDLSVQGPHSDKMSVRNS